MSGHKCDKDCEEYYCSILWEEGYNEQYFIEKYECEDWDQVCNKVIKDGIFVGREQTDPEVKAFTRLMSDRIKQKIKEGKFTFFWE